MRFCVAAALLIAGALAQAQAGLDFRMEVATPDKPGAGSVSSRLDHVTETSQVVLGDRYRSVTTLDQAGIYDLAGRRRYQVDLKTGTFVDYSLFDTVGFGVMEVKNRESLGRTLAAGKVDQIVFDPGFDEYSLSVPSQTARTLAESEEGGDTVLSIDGKPLTRIAADRSGRHGGQCERCLGVHPLRS